MISERKFSNSYSSFWNQILPTADSFVRRLNLACRRFTVPIDSIVPVNGDKRAVINELAFRLFKEKANGKDLSNAAKTELEGKVRLYIERLSPNILKIEALSQAEQIEAEELENALFAYFQSLKLTSLSFWPLFNGCGWLNACKADILCEGKLIEVKAGDRYFRITDIRQIITYLTLNFNSHQYTIDHIALVNPRKGLEFETSVEIFIESCSGRKPVDVFSDIVDFVSAEVRSI